MTGTEQIDRFRTFPHNREARYWYFSRRANSWRSFVKKEHTRTYRRNSKKLLEDCPPRNRYKGWCY